jgi:hypothetical protein
LKTDRLISELRRQIKGTILYEKEENNLVNSFPGQGKRSILNTNNSSSNNPVNNINSNENRRQVSFLPRLNKNSEGEENFTPGDELISNPVIEYFRENASEKELFDDLLGVRKNVQTLENEISKMIEHQMKFFKTKYECFKNGTAKQSIHYDLMYSCLFGNHIVL